MKEDITKSKKPLDENMFAILFEEIQNIMIECSKHHADDINIIQNVVLEV
jgi:hypothetical protein